MKRLEYETGVATETAHFSANHRGEAINLSHSSLPASINQSGREIFSDPPDSFLPSFSVSHRSRQILWEASNVIS